MLLGPTQRFVVEGDEGTSLFLVGDGEVEVRLRNDDGTDWLVETMGRGEVVGEMALLTGETRCSDGPSVNETSSSRSAATSTSRCSVAHPEWLDELAAMMERTVDPPPRPLRRDRQRDTPDAAGADHPKLLWRR